MTNGKTLRIVVFHEDGMLIAQCLEHDICTQGPDIETLKSRMDCLIQAELAEGQDIRPAPDRFHQMWDEPPTNGAGDNYRLAA